MNLRIFQLNSLLLSFLTLLKFLINHSPSKRNLSKNNSQNHRINHAFLHPLCNSSEIFPLLTQNPACLTYVAHLNPECIAFCKALASSQVFCLRCLHFPHKIPFECIYFSLKQTHILKRASNKQATGENIGNWCTDCTLSLRYNIITFFSSLVYTKRSIDQQ